MGFTLVGTRIGDSGTRPGPEPLTPGTQKPPETRPTETRPPEPTRDQASSPYRRETPEERYRMTQYHTSPEECGTQDTHSEIPQIDVVSHEPHITTLLCAYRMYQNYI